MRYLKVVFKMKKLLLTAKVIYRPFQSLRVSSSRLDRKVRKWIVLLFCLSFLIVLILVTMVPYYRAFLDILSASILRSITLAGILGGLISGLVLSVFFTLESDASRDLGDKGRVGTFLITYSRNLSLILIVVLIFLVAVFLQASTGLEK